MMTTATKPEPIRLRFSEGQTQVLVEPEDHDKFVLCVEEAITACRILGVYKSLFEEQLDHLKNTLAQWLHQRRNKIYKAFLTLQDARMLFLVVMNQQTYDGTLEEELTDLEFKITEDSQCSQINLDVQGLPLCGDDAYMSFCNPGWLLEYLMPDA